LLGSGLFTYQEWFGLEEAMEEVHEFFANSLGLIALVRSDRRAEAAMPAGEHGHRGEWGHHADDAD